MNVKLLGFGALTPVLLAFGVAVAATGSGALDPVASSIGCVAAIDPSAPVNQTIKDLNATQLGHAKTVYDVSVEMKLPPRAAVVALATVAQESYFKNMANPTVPKSMTLPHEGQGADHDSVGLFQQRPLPPDGEGGWGTVEELMTPKISAMKFYSALKRIDGWETLPITVAAQKVQISAFPDAYAKHEPLATALVALIGGGAVTCQNGAVGAGGWAKPVPGGINSYFREPGREDHYGVDLGGTRGTPIHAASSGIVLIAECNGGSNCDEDGSMSTPGYGWKVDILHPDRTVTRYGHMWRQPFVRTGQTVQAGQVIGLMGTSGNSSGVHLHFETHTGAPANNANAVDPLPFMAARGVTLGKSG
ncbi:M23 family metallopeptidase [Catelliglobosispora koreensis]|uniref:M23 family metallopeptidase n=1 Tax=Catelliglobosispora koreensis TaxID=129052 RepID=UPI0003682CDB|nr:M23 family metallopeptidase [Catelliglobosispora koreensis]